MHVIFINSYLEKYNFISFFYIQTNLFQYPFHFFTEYYFSIFCRAYYVVHENRYIMAFVNICAFHTPYFIIFLIYKD